MSSKKLQFKDIHEKYEESFDDNNLTETLLTTQNNRSNSRINVTEEDPLNRANSNENQVDLDMTTNARIFEAGIDNKEVAEIEDKIEDFFGYVIFIWILFIVHFINLGYFLFMLFLNYNNTNAELSKTLVWASCWNLLQITIWWHAFLGREQHHLKRHTIAVYGLLICFCIISVGLLLLCFGYMLMPDILFEAASGLLWSVLKQSSLNFISYIVAGVLELIAPVYMFISAWKIKDLLEKRKELLEIDEKTKSIRE